MKTKEINGQQWIQPSDLYEWTIEELSKGTFNSIMEEETLEHLRGVEYKINYLKSLNGLELIRVYHTVLRGMQDDSLQLDPMIWSAMYYNFTQKGLDTGEMRIAINNNLTLVAEIKKRLPGITE